MSTPNKERSKRERDLRNTPEPDLRHSCRFSLDEVCSEVARRIVTSEVLKEVR